LGKDIEITPFAQKKTEMLAITEEVPIKDINTKMLTRKNSEPVLLKQNTTGAVTLAVNSMLVLCVVVCRYKRDRLSYLPEIVVVIRTAIVENLMNATTDSLMQQLHTRSN
jgi:hypothetical protein